MVTKEQVTDALFDACSDRTLGVKDTIKKVCDSLGVSSNNKLEDTVRQYKQTGSGLENAANSIVESLNQSCPAGNTDTNCTGNCNDCGNVDCDPFKDLITNFTSVDFAQKVDQYVLFEVLLKKLNKFS